MSEISAMPVLCRLCECPVADDGVRVDLLDSEKVSEWWRRKLDAEFDAEDSKDELICQFCLWSARREHEHSNADENHGGGFVDWWSGYDVNPNYHKYFYKDEIIKQCRVDLGVKISIPDDTSTSATRPEPRETVNPRRSTRQFKKCVYCGDKFPETNMLVEHVKKVHKGSKTFKCNECTIYFATKKEQQDHRNFHIFTRICGGKKISFTDFKPFSKLYSNKYSRR